MLHYTPLFKLSHLFWYFLVKVSLIQDSFFYLNLWVFTQRAEPSYFRLPLNASQHLPAGRRTRSGRSCEAGPGHALVLLPHLSKGTDCKLHHSPTQRRKQTQDRESSELRHKQTHFSVIFSLDATMLPFKRTFDSEKQQLQQLNSRLVQYLSRTKQLEQENAHLVSEINRLRQVRTAEREPKYKEEMRDLRRVLGQLSFEKSQAEMEKEKLWRELQMVKSLCSEQTDVCRDISGELQGRGMELRLAHQTNTELQQRLVQLENEYKRLEDAHRQEMLRLQRQVDSRVVPIITQTYRGPPAASMEEVQEYARGLSEGWMETFEMYQQKVEDMEQSIKADQAKLNDMQREKMLYVSELDKLHREAEKQGQIQVRLEDQLMNMQEKVRVDFSEYEVRKSLSLQGGNGKGKKVSDIYRQERGCFIFFIYGFMELQHCTSNDITSDSKSIVSH